VDLQRDESGGLLMSHPGVPSVGSNHLGSYFVVVNNAHGAVTSRVASLEWAWPPAIVQPPQSLSVRAGEHATFSVEVTNNATLPIGYQLRKGSVIITNVVLSTRTCALTLFNVTTNSACPTNGPGNYRIVATNAANYLPGVGSSSVRLTVLPPPPPLTVGLCLWSSEVVSICSSGGHRVRTTRSWPRPIWWTGWSWPSHRVRCRIIRICRRPWGKSHPLLSPAVAVNFLLNPDHEALRSFVPDDIRHGAIVFYPNQEKKRPGTWQNGQVVDEAGTRDRACDERAVNGYHRDFYPYLDSANGR